MITEKQRKARENYYKNGGRPWNYNLTKETDIRIKKMAKKVSKRTKGVKKPNVSKILKEKYKSGDLVVWNKGIKGLMKAWNKGLTKETDNRVKKVSENEIRKAKIKKAMENREITWGDKISKTKRENPKRRSQETRRKDRLGRIKYIESCVGQIHPTYNKKSIIFFDEINKKYDFNGFHAENKDEFFVKDLGYWVDYYEPNINLVIEWNEERHYIGKDKSDFSKKHIARQQEIKEHLKCHFINIRQRYFEQSKEFILKRIEKIIEENQINKFMGNIKNG